MWGRSDAFVWQGVSLIEQGRLDDAEASFEAALALRPEYPWVLDEMLPLLASKRSEGS